MSRARRQQREARLLQQRCPEIQASAADYLETAMALLQKKQYEEGASYLQQAMRIFPTDERFFSALMPALFLLGRFEEAWKIRDRFRQLSGKPAISVNNMRFAGRQVLFCPDAILGDNETWSLHGRAVVKGECVDRSFGDTLMNVRFAPFFQQRGAHVTVLSQAPLAELVATCPGVESVIVPAQQEIPQFHVHVQMSHLPYFFRLSPSTIPAKVPYLSADPACVERWRMELNREPGFKVGICWQGDPRHQNDFRRSIPLQQFAPLAGLDGVRLYSLQVGHGGEQVASANFPLTDLGSRFNPASFADAAAVVRMLDLVISVDTAVVHLAGALARPVWVLLADVFDWRWFLDREDSPWYPTMRLFRQKAAGDWAGVFDRVKEALAELVCRHGFADGNGR
jgi:hypothetical protein